jgi:signal transduction histidine kinase
MQSFSHRLPVAARSERWVRRTLTSGAQLTVYQRFLIASLIVMFSCMSGVGWWLGKAIEAGVIERTSATTAVYVESFVAPSLQEFGAVGRMAPEQQALLAQMLHGTLLGKQIVAFVVWAPDGRVLYSTDGDQIGQRFPLTDDLEASFQGQVSAEFAGADAEVHTPHQSRSNMLLSTYTPVHQIGSDRVIAVAEFYQDADAMLTEIRVAQWRSWAVVALATLMMYAALIWFVQRVSATISSQKKTLVDQVDQLTELLGQNAELNERIRRATARNAELNERFLRRVGADLHDGPAQYLGLALLRFDHLFAHAETCAGGAGITDTLQAVHHALQGALSEVRAISSGLALPELDVLSLRGVVTRVVRAHEQRTRTSVGLSIGDLPDLVSLPVKITVYRLIQEALNNAYRHAGGVGQQVRVAAANNTLSIDVSDQGPGFVAVCDTDVCTEHLGLVGMRDRVASMGGQFLMRSEPGCGTRVSAVLPMQMLEDACA